MRGHLGIAILSGIAMAASSAIVWVLLRSRLDPAERERRRRAHITARGRLIEGMVADVADSVVYYTYSWRGVDYEASQDLSAVLIDLDLSPDTLTGPVTVKFLPGDASNSIVLSETWSGFPRYRPATLPKM